MSPRGHLLELYRNYLRLMARALISQPLRVRLDASDLVQETFLKAHREFSQFLGSTEPELVAWLRQIQVRSLADQLKRHRAKGRDYRREEPMEVILDRSSQAIQSRLAAPLSSPSSRTSRREQVVLLANALEKCLPTIARSSSCVIWSTCPSTRSLCGWVDHRVRSASSGRGPCWHSNACWRNRRHDSRE